MIQEETYKLDRFVEAYNSEAVFLISFIVALSSLSINFLLNEQNWN